jgi:hypothetical protein
VIRAGASAATARTAALNADLSPGAARPHPAAVAYPKIPRYKSSGGLEGASNFACQD